MHHAHTYQPEAVAGQSTRKYRLSDFFDAHWDAYCQNPVHRISEDQYRAVNAMRVCRTAVLGQRVYACPDCGDLSETYHSCKHRFCPHCAWSDTMKWAEKASEKLLDIPHRHAVATLPHALNGLLARNYRTLNAALLRASAYAVKEWMQAKYRVTPGIMSVLHTFGERKNRHHHAHMIVSSGGVNKQTQKIHTVALEYIPYRFLSKKFRHKFEAYLIEHFDAGELSHDFENRIELLTFLKKTNKDDWRFHFEAPMQEPESVMRYIGRYSKRACLSEYKITNIQGEYISFRYKDYKDRKPDNSPNEKVLCLHYRDFFPRLLQHVPAKGFQLVRYYGMYAGASKITHTGKAREDKPLQAPTAYRGRTYCMHCNQEKQLIYIILDTRKPKERREKLDTQKHAHLIIRNRQTA